MKKLIYLIAILVLMGMASATVNDYTARFTFDSSATEEISSIAMTYGGGQNYSTGQISNAVEFNGSNGYGYMGTDFMNMNTSDFSISFWIYPDAWTGQDYIMHKRTNVGTFSQYGFTRETGGRVKFRTYNTAASDADSTFNITEGRWWHIVGVRNSTHMILYVNGTLNNATARTLRNVSNTGHFVLGSSSNISLLGAYFDGRIDDLRFYTRSLNASDVQELYLYDGTEPNYYFSQSGSDSADCSQSTPCKTITKANTLTGNKYFMCGDSWLFPQDAYLELDDNYDVKGYGTCIRDGVTTNFPKFYGAYNWTNWTNLGGNIWRSNITFTTEIGQVYHQNLTAFTRDWNLSSFAAGDFYYNATNDYVYVYSATAPGYLLLAQSTIIVNTNNWDYGELEQIEVLAGSNNGISGQAHTHNHYKNVSVHHIGGALVSGTKRFGNCIQLWSGSQNNEIDHNIVHDCYDAGITQQYSSGTNTVIGNVSFHHNIVYNSAYPAEYFQEDTGSFNYNVSFTQNTFYKSGWGWYYPQRVDPYIDGVCFRSGNKVSDDPIAGIVFKDNICAYVQEWETDAYMLRFNDNWVGWQTDANLTIDYNLYYGYDGLPDFALWGPNSWDTVPTLAEFQSTYNKDLNSAEGDPLFIDADNGNFTPYSNSPACTMSSTGSYVGALPCSAEATPDTTTPSITYISNQSTTNQSTLINVTTTEAANLTISYGITMGLGLSAYNISFQNNSIATLSGLDDGTTYYYNVTACDSSGNCANNGTFSFTTQDSTTPSILTITNSSVQATSLYIEFTLGEEGNAVAYISASTDFTDRITKSNTGYSTEHSLYMSPLGENTLYYWYVEGYDVAGNRYNSSVFSVTTLNLIEASPSGGGGGSTIDDDEDVVNDTIVNEPTIDLPDAVESVLDTVDQAEGVTSIRDKPFLGKLIEYARSDTASNLLSSDLFGIEGFVSGVKNKVDSWFSSLWEYKGTSQITMLKEDGTIEKVPFEEKVTRTVAEAREKVILWKDWAVAALMGIIIVGQQGLSMLIRIKR